MSYILDALRKADAERERDPARGIHAQPVVPLAPSPQAAWKRGPLIAVGLALLALAAAVASWRPTPAPLAPGVAAAVAGGAPVRPAVPAAPAAVLLPPPPPMPVAAAEPVAKPAPKLIAKVQTAAAAPVAAASAAERILSIAEAPPEVQKLAVSGGVHSENAAQRMLVVGGQVFNEGSEIAPGVVLEQVRPKSAVVKLRGQRYAVPF